VSCRAGFSAALCAHHSAHDTFRIDVREGRYCARCTGSEPWFHVFDGIDVSIFFLSPSIRLQPPTSAVTATTTLLLSCCVVVDQSQKIDASAVTHYTNLKSFTYNTAFYLFSILE
jgi:hypothetical protein